jgi:uridine phosphorylase
VALKPHVLTGDQPAPRYVLLPGDPGRVPTIGSTWEAYEELSFNREFRYGRGRIAGVGIGACSTGIGAPSAEIALIELAAAGSDTFIRVGMCGAIQPEIELGTLVIHEGAVRLVGGPNAYCEPEFPAIADRVVTFALIEACEQLGLRYAVGLTASTDSFFAGQENVLPLRFDATSRGIVDRMRGYGVATFEMEAAALFVLGSLLKRRCGSICSVESNRATGERADVSHAIGNAIAVANRAVTLLARWDERLRVSGGKYVSPSLLHD